MRGWRAFSSLVGGLGAVIVLVFAWFIVVAGSALGGTVGNWTAGSVERVVTGAGVHTVDLDASTTDANPVVAVTMAAVSGVYASSVVYCGGVRADGNSGTRALTAATNQGFNGTVTLDSCPGLNSEMMFYVGYTSTSNGTYGNCRSSGIKWLECVGPWVDEELDRVSITHTDRWSTGGATSTATVTATPSPSGTVTETVTVSGGTTVLATVYLTGSITPTPSGSVADGLVVAAGAMPSLVVGILFTGASVVALLIVLALAIRAVSVRADS